MKTRRDLRIIRSSPGPARKEPGSPGSPAEADRQPGQDIPWLDMEQTYFLEELELSVRATDIIRRTRQLQRLFSRRNESASPPSRPSGKGVPRIPSSIAPQELEGRITSKLKDERAYLNEELSLAALAHTLSIEPHQLSRFLNLRLHTTFSALINSYRVDEAKALLTEEPGWTILDVAFAAGFNSKASFNRIFKKLTGMTPSEYRMKMRCRGAPDDGA